MPFISFICGLLIGHSAVQVLANENYWWTIGLVIGIIGLVVDFYLLIKRQREEEREHRERMKRMFGEDFYEKVAK